MSFEDLDKSYEDSYGDSYGDSSEDLEKVVAVEELTVRYGNQTVLDRFNLHIRQGQVYALLGRNGAGKSSLVRCLLGQQPATKGKVELFGRDSWKFRSQLMGRVGVVPEESDAPPSMTCARLSRFCAGLYDRWDATGFNTRLERFQISQKQSFGKLSRGQKAQVMLALALAPSPDLLVLDDPTLGLDVVARRAVFEDLVDELATRPLTVLLTSHDLPGIERLAGHIAVLRDGRPALDEELESVKQRYRWLDLVDAADAEALADMQPVSTQSRGRGSSVLVEQFEDQAFDQLRDALGADRISSRAPTLEEIVVVHSHTSTEAEVDRTARESQP